MLTRSEMDDLRTQIADAADAMDADLLDVLAVRLHDELERARFDIDNLNSATRILNDALDQCREQREQARAELDRAQRGERDARRLLAGLVAASKATLAAFADDQPEAARAILGHELHAHGWEPAPDSHAWQILADAATAFRDAGLTEALHAAA